MKVKTSFSIIIILLTLGMVGITNAQETVPHAAVVDSQLLYFAADGSTTVIDDTMNMYLDIVWNADGSQVAYVAFDADFNTLTKVATRNADNTFSSFVVTDVAATGFPLSFTADGLLLYAGQGGMMDNNSPDVAVPVYTLQPTEGAAPTQIATIPFGMGCGGGSSFPMDGLYAREGGGGLAYNLILELTPNGLVYSRDCVGFNTVLYDLNAQSVVEFSEQFGQAELSPDRTRVAGAQTSDTSWDGAPNIYTVNLADQSLTVHPTSQVVERLVWGADGNTVYYSTRQVTENFTAPPAFYEQAMIDPSVPFPLYESAIIRLNLADNTETELWRGTGFAVGRMVWAGDDLMLFSLIPNGDTWANNIANGGGDPFDGTGVQVDLYQLNVASDEASMIGTNKAQVTVP